jgi:cytochrome b involved in lipid metabolism
MKISALLIGLVSVVVLASGCVQQNGTGNGNGNEVPGETPVYTLDEISGHDSSDDCWLLIDGKVYDVTEFATHPGGEAILEGCGKDATTLFETRPMGSGTPHSTNARNLREDYYIGDLEA